jgi:FkbM family methyltransferase
LGHFASNCNSAELGSFVLSNGYQLNQSVSYSTVMQLEGIKSTIRILVPRGVRNWLRSPAKAFSWVWQSVRFRCGFNDRLEISDGHSLLCHPLVYRAAQTAQVRDPEQAAEFHQFVSYCHPGMFLFDVGASFGIFSLACARLGGKAIAMDPSPIATDMIAKQLRLNNLKDSVRILEAAIGDTDGTIEMLSAGIYSDGYYRCESGREKTELTSVPVTTLDYLAERFGLPSHLKIDVEGYEAAAIRGARELLKRASPLVFLELHNEMVRASGGDVAFCVHELLKLGYKIFSAYGTPLSVEQALKPPICRVLALP